MCLVFIGWRIEGCAPVRIGANREEWRTRPMTSPVCRRSGIGAASEVGSLRCLLAGADFGPDGSFPTTGTWLGVNEADLVVAVTNRNDGVLPWPEQTRSKGLLAVDLLACRRATDAAQLARGELASGGFGGCNYLLADRETAFVVQAPGAARVEVLTLEPGVHAMTNLDLDDPDDPRIKLVHSRFDPRDFPASAARICRDDRIIVDEPERGTIASSLVSVGESVTFDHICGDPRKHDYIRYRWPDEGTD
ncbi:MAG: NRDE family protein [Isosphaeraceae bacterium]